MEDRRMDQAMAEHIRSNLVLSNDYRELLRYKKQHELPSMDTDVVKLAWRLKRQDSDKLAKLANYERMTLALFEKELAFRLVKSPLYELNPASDLPPNWPESKKYYYDILIRDHMMSLAPEDLLKALTQKLQNAFKPNPPAYSGWVAQQLAEQLAENVLMQVMIPWAYPNCCELRHREIRYCLVKHPDVSSYVEKGLLLKRLVRKFRLDDVAYDSEEEEILTRLVAKLKLHATVRIPFDLALVDEDDEFISGKPVVVDDDNGFDEDDEFNLFKPDDEDDEFNLFKRLPSTFTDK